MSLMLVLNHTSVKALPLPCKASTIPAISTRSNELPLEHAWSLLPCEDALTPEVINDPEEYLKQQLRVNRSYMLKTKNGSRDNERAFQRMNHFCLETAKIRDEKSGGR